MTCVRFYKYFMFLISLQWTNCSLLSRFRYPNEYVASPETMVPPEDLPKDLYANLNEERPDLKPILETLWKNHLRHPQMRYFRKTTIPVTESESDSEYEYRNEGTPTLEYDDDNSSNMSTSRYTYEPDEDDNATTTASFLSNSSNLMPFLSRQNANDSRRLWQIKDNGDESGERWLGPIVARCYHCNAFARNVPINSNCHDAFVSNDGRQGTLKRVYRTVCYYYNDDQIRSRIEEFSRSPRNYTVDKGLKRGYSGRYIGGCYKRFLDIGEIYTSRGCRMSWPQRDRHFGNHRMVRLELLLTDKKEGCLSSPHASLTPFARGISLYTRYHVCICKGRYCNKASVNETPKFLLFVALLFIDLLY